jgi:hypothetical protein
MKSNHQILLLGMAVLMALGTVTQAQAHDYPDGYWDHHGHYRHYEIYHRHRGYWDDGPHGRIFINIG